MPLEQRRQQPHANAGRGQKHTVDTAQQFAPLVLIQPGDQLAKRRLGEAVKKVVGEKERHKGPWRWDQSHQAK